MNIKIGIAYHKNSPILSNDIYMPIHVGKSLHPDINLCIQADNEGDNISEENGYYCELTATYWLWKNVVADYKGLCHYRRVFTSKYSAIDNIRNYILGIRNRMYIPQKTYINANDFIQDSIKISDDLKEILHKYPIIAPKKIITAHTLYQHFVIIGNDYIEILKQVVNEDCPEIMNTLLTSLNTHSFYYANMVVMRNDYYNEYCEFLFSILNNVKIKMLSEGWIRSTDEFIFNRKLGYLAELLTNVFILTKENSGVPIKRMAESMLR